MELNTKAPSVLVADDDEAIRQLLAIELERQGFEVIGAANGREALEKARSRLPDLVLTDIQMPVMDGLEVTRRLREGPETRRIPVLIMSVLGAKDAIVKGLEAGAVDYITKPFFLPELKARIRSVLRFKRVQDELLVIGENLIRDRLAGTLRETREIIHETLRDNVAVIVKDVDEIRQAIQNINATVGRVDFLETMIFDVYGRISDIAETATPVEKGP